MVYFWGWLLLFVFSKSYLCYEVSNLAVLELFLQSEKEQWSRVGSCTLDAAAGAAGNLEVLACGLTDETQMCFPVQCLPWFALFPADVQVHRIQRKSGYEPQVQQDFILQNKWMRKGNREELGLMCSFLKRTLFALLLFKMYLDNYLFGSLWWHTLHPVQWFQ